MKTLSVIGICLFLLAWGMLFRPVVLGGPASYIIVSGVSMEPAYDHGDLVVMRKAGQYAVGDVIAYTVKDKGNVIHRIVGGSASSGFLTQGDNKKEIDPWSPKPEEILGKLWLHIPSAGNLLNGLRNPAGLTGLAGLTVLLFIDDLFPEKKKTRRGKRMKNNGSSHPLPFRWSFPGSLSGQSSARQIAALLLPVTVIGLVLGVLFLAAALFSGLQPARKMEPVSRTRYAHNAVFRYTVSTLPSALFDGTTIGPVGPETAQTTDVPPVITELAQSVDIDLRYALTDFGDGDLRGQVKPVLRIEIGEEWKQSFPIGEPVIFQGAAVDTRITIPMDQFREWVAAIAEELGYQPNAFQARVIPTITLTGTVDGQPVDETYTPEFTIIVRAAQAQMDTELSRREEVFRETTEERDQYFQFWRINWRIAEVQRITGLLAALLLLPSAILALLLAWWMRDDELFFIHARYGGMLIAVAQVDLHQSRQIQVASMKDMARLAQQNGGVIFWKAFNDGSRLFFIPEGQLTYLLMVPDRKRED